MNKKSNVSNHFYKIICKKIPVSRFFAPIYRQIFGKKYFSPYSPAKDFFSPSLISSLCLYTTTLVRLLPPHYKDCVCDDD